MFKFNYYNPTHIVFGSLGKETPEYFFYSYMKPKVCIVI